MNRIVNAALVASALGFGSAVMVGNVEAQQQVLNLYSSRHYQTDEALYANFEKATGIKVNRIDGPEDPLIERLKSEGDKSPADLLVTVDMGRLLKAQQLGLFQPIQSKLLDEKIPAEPGRGKNGQPFEWHFGLPVDAAGKLPDGRPFADACAIGPG